MARKVYGPVEATFVSCPDDSSIKYAEGVRGILQVCISERKHPGHYFAILYYRSDQDYHEESELCFTDKFIETSCCKVDVEWPQLIFHREKGGDYVFEVMEGTAFQEL